MQIIKAKYSRSWCSQGRNVNSQDRNHPVTWPLGPRSLNFLKGGYKKELFDVPIHPVEELEMRFKWIQLSSQKICEGRYGIPSNCYCSSWDYICTCSDLSYTKWPWTNTHYCGDHCKFTKTCCTDVWRSCGYAPRTNRCSRNNWCPGRWHPKAKSSQTRRGLWAVRFVKFIGPGPLVLPPGACCQTKSKEEVMQTKKD